MKIVITVCIVIACIYQYKPYHDLHEACLLVTRILLQAIVCII